MALKDQFGQLTKRDFLMGLVGGAAGMKGGEWAWQYATGEWYRRYYAVPSYAQAGEDLIVQRFLYYIHRDKPTYLDLGAFHPVAGNNTYLLNLNGGHGVLVEPNVDLISELRRVRPADKVLNIGVGVSTVAEADYYRASEPAWNTFDKETADKYDKTTGGKITIKEVVKMPLVNVNEIIAQHLGAAPDFISIDIEGLDLAVLKTFDFTKYRPAAFCVETIEEGTTKHNPEITEFMASKGYAVHGMTFFNSIFVDKKLIDT